MSRHPARVAVVCTAVVALAVFFREMLGSGFDLIPAGYADGRFLIAILEHWRSVLVHGAPLASPPFFAPEPGVLGYSESMALFVPPYVLGRALGLDRYLAFAAALGFVKALGFAGMYLLLRRALGTGRLAAASGATLFTLWNGSWLSAGHAQLMTVAFVPVVGLLVHRWVRTRALWPLATAAVVLALMLFTSFYIGWFTIMVVGLLLAVGAAGTLIGAVTPPDVAHGRGRRTLGQLAMALLVFAAAVAPFLYVYLPSLHRLGGRTAEEVWLYLARPQDLWNVGEGNRVWGRTLAPFAWGPRYVYAHFETERGWPPLTLAVFFATLGAAVWVLRGSAPRDARWARRGVACGAATILGWVVIQRIGDFSPWWWVYRLVPGASAIRAPVRLSLVLNCLVVAVVALGLDRVARRAGWGHAAAALLALLVVGEQWNDTKIARLSRTTERWTFGAVQAPPPACRVFYVASEHAGVAGLTTDSEAQVDAILIAQDFGIATINGYSGSRPPGWNLDTTRADYEENARAWAAAHGLDDGLCRLEISSGRWEPASARVTASR